MGDDPRFEEALEVKEERKKERELLKNRIRELEDEIARKSGEFEKLKNRLEELQKRRDENKDKLSSPSDSASPEDLDEIAMLEKIARAEEAARLRVLRATLGMSQSEMAEEFGVSRMAIDWWEGEERTIPGPILKLIALYESRQEKRK